jgi:hypothetical protein
MPLCCAWGQNKFENVFRLLYFSVDHSHFLFTSILAGIANNSFSVSVPGFLFLNSSILSAFIASVGVDWSLPKNIFSNLYNAVLPIDSVQLQV